jgi:hypothetical protein
MDGDRRVRIMLLLDREAAPLAERPAGDEHLHQQLQGSPGPRTQIPPMVSMFGDTTIVAAAVCVRLGADRCNSLSLLTVFGNVHFTRMSVIVCRFFLEF